MNSDTEESDEFDYNDVEMNSSDEMISSSDEDESDGVQVIKLDLSPLPKNKSFECCTLDKIKSWFKDLVDYLERKRTRDKLPSCKKISEQLLINLNFDVSEISSIYNIPIEDRIKNDTLLDHVGIKEPKKEFEIPMEEGDCDICCIEGSLQSTGFCNHMYCDNCLSIWFEEKLEHSTLISCMDGDCKYIYRDSIIERQLQPSANSSVRFQKTFDAIMNHSKNSGNKLPWILHPCPTPDCSIYFRINKEIKATNFNTTVTLKCDHCQATYCSDYLLALESSPPLISPGFLYKEECPCHSGHEPIACSYLGDFANFKAKDRVVKKKEVDNSNAEFIRNRTRDCPRCGTKVFKDEGCDHMRCTCGQSFCWRCKYKYRYHHEHHVCDENEQQEGRFDIEYKEIEKKIEDENKIPHQEIVKAIEEREDDLRILRFKFEGLNVDELSANDSGNESESELRDDADLKRMAQFEDLIKSRVKAQFKFWYPRYFLNTKYLKAENAYVDNSKLHVFDYAFYMSQDLLKRLEKANRTTGNVLKFCFFLKRSETSTKIVKNFREDMIGFFNKAVTLGKQTVDYIIALQDPANDDAAFKKFRETNGQDLVSLIRKWEYGCKDMESRMKLMIDRIRKESLQEDGGSFSFWHNTNFETIPLLPYQTSNVPKPELPNNQGPSTSRQNAASSTDSSPGKDSGFASPSAASKEFVPIVPPGTDFQVLYDHVTGEPTGLYYPELNITLPIQ